MCGIAGIFRLGAPPDLEPLDRMRDALTWRGPDDGLSARFPQGGLAVRRLAIMDPAHGRQPLCDGSGRIWIAMNGEIYNQVALRKEWEARGTRFRTTCDTEVVAEVVASLGFEGALQRFTGMFALAAWDTRDRRLWLARDRMGEKPLYYTTLDDGTFLFGSQLMALLQHGGLSRRVDPAAVARYLLFEYIPTPTTIWSGVRRLEPGACLCLDATGLTWRRYWDRPIPEEGCGSPRDLERWARSLAGAFQVSVLGRRLADVPIGFLVSGGLDSASVLAVAARRHPPPFQTFTVSLPSEPSFDEARHARTLTEVFPCNHKEIPFHPENLPEVLSGIGQRLDEPLADSSLAVTWWLFQHVQAAGLKVVLSGDGGDELMGGYPTYQAHRLAPLVAPFRGSLYPLVRRLPVSFDNVSFDYKARRFLAGLDLPLARRNQVWLGAFLPEELPPDLVEGAWAEVDAHGASVQGRDPICQALALDQRLYLGDGVLTKVDRASQAFGVEVRAPFLDHHLVELAAQVPVGLKVRGRRLKAVWKQATSHILPPSIRERPKKGFGTPVGPWLRGACTHLLDGMEEPVEEWVSPDRVRALVKEHREGRADHRRRLWSLLVLGRWRQGPWGPGR